MSTVLKALCLCGEFLPSSRRPAHRLRSRNGGGGRKKWKNEHRMHTCWHLRLQNAKKKSRKNTKVEREMIVDEGAIGLHCFFLFSEQRSPDHG